MRRSRLVLVGAAVSASTLLSGVVLSPATAGAAAPAPPGGSGDGVVDLPLTGPDGQRSDFLPAVLDPDRQVTVMLEVAGEPVAQAQAQALDAGGELSDGRRAALRATLADRQAPIRQRVETLEGRVLSAMQDAYNGVKVRVPRSALAEVAALPDVVAVHAVPTYERTNDDSVPFLGVPQEMWQDLGLTGEGVSIGVVDTGIDYTHAAFGGPGTTAAYTANDPTVIEDGAFPTVKVVGGHDFVGDAYNASAEPTDAALVPVPDPDPLDCQGHGTHVAGTAAGMGVLADGSTFTGPYDSSTHEQDFTVGPGVAPRASLYALKVFGCEGSTDVLAEAVNWAVAHDLDVINLSVGSDFSVLGDAETTAIENAARAGVIPVLASGNGGDISYITGSPGTAERAISVAAVSSLESVPGAVLSAGATQVALQVSNDIPIPTPISGPLVVLQDEPTTPGNESLGCAAGDFAGAAGAVVVTFRGACPRVDRAVLGQAAGAVAVVMVNDAPQLPPFEGPVPEVRIPFLGAPSDQADELVALAGQVVTVAAGPRLPNPGFRAPADFTSAGPALAGDTAKPDLAAPGVGIVSADVGTGTGGVPASGTSMAAPHVAGVAALVREARPDLDVATLKAAIVNTADPGGTTAYRTLRVGAGLVDPDEAVRTPVVALGDPGTASLSFGFVESDRVVTEHRTITLRNTSAEQVRFAVSVEPSSQPQGGAEVSVQPGSVTAPAHGEVQVGVTVTVTPSTDLPPEGLQAASGTVAFTPVDAGQAVTLRVPYVLVHRATSDLRTRPGDVRAPRGGTVGFTTRNRSQVPGTADVFAWGFDDPAGDDVVRGGLAPDIRAVGVQAFPDGTPPAGKPQAPGVGVFAIHTHARLGNAAAAEYTVLVDVDEDGSAEFAVVGLDLGLLTVGAFTGQFAAVTVHLGSRRIVRALPATGAINSATVTLPFILSDVGLSPANPDFLYNAETSSLVAAGADEVVGRAAFDAFDQPVETGQLLRVPARGSVGWTAAVDAVQLQATPVLGWMVVYPQNRSGSDQAELIRLRGARR